MTKIMEKNNNESIPARPMPADIAELRSQVTVLARKSRNAILFNLVSIPLSVIIMVCSENLPTNHFIKILGFVLFMAGWVHGYYVHGARKKKLEAFIRENDEVPYSLDFMKKSHNENIPARPMDDAELQSQITVLAEKWRSAPLFGLASFALAVIFVICGKYTPTYMYFCLAAAGVAMIFSLSCCVLYAKSRSDLKAFTSANILRNVLGEFFQVEEYIFNTHISEKLIRGAKLIFDWNHSEGSDFVRGKYRGYDILFSNVHLEKKVHESQSSNSRVRETTATIFKGQWIILHHDRELPASLHLWEKRGLLNRNKIEEHEIQTENSAFNDKYEIASPDAHTAFLILTPHFMEYIIAADIKANGDTFMRFGDSTVCVAIHNNKYLFEIRNEYPVVIPNVKALRRDCRKNLKYLTDILDELMKNHYLFRGGK